MRTISATWSALCLASLTAVAASTPAPAAGRPHTPTAEQTRFYDELKSGKRPSTRKSPTKAARRALEAAPKTATGLAAPAATAPASTAVYVSAHPDDFVLFMYPHRDVVADNTRTVFVFLTAGDAGQGKGPTSAPYYLAREAGAFRAVRFMADAWNWNTASPSSGTVRINGHSIYRTTYKNTTTLFLRLPDGAGEGSGYPVHNWASLMKLRNGEIASIRAVDGSTTYTSWNDLVKTLSEIVRTQASGSPNVWIDAHDPDAASNPGDHSDHWATGLAVAALPATLPCVNYAYHVGYAASGLVNLDVADIENRSAGFANYTSGLAEKGYPGVSWEPGHMSWLAGMIYRLSNGNGQTCTF